VRSRSSRLSTTSFASIGLPLPAPRSQGPENRCRNQRHCHDEDEHGNDEVRLLLFPPEVLQVSVHQLHGIHQPARISVAINGTAAMMQAMMPTTRNHRVAS
jgi:hypothetical protein